MYSIAERGILCFSTVADGDAYLVAAVAFFRRLAGIFAVVSAVAVGFIGGLTASAGIFSPGSFAYNGGDFS